MGNHIEYNEGIRIMKFDVAIINEQYNVINILRLKW